MRSRSLALLVLLLSVSAPGCDDAPIKTSVDREPDAQDMRVPDEEDVAGPEDVTPEVDTAPEDLEEPRDFALVDQREPDATVDPVDIASPDVSEPDIEETCMERDGIHYRVELPSDVDGELIVFEVYEPLVVDCGAKHPLVLHASGFGGERSTDDGTGSDSAGGNVTVSDMLQAGYAVVSIDHRGHGESGGTIRVMDPEFEGRDYVQVIDWAEANLDFLAYRDENLLLGAIGGSYGGGYQMSLWALDPKQRIDVLIPEITWHDLTYSLNPGGVPKSTWALVLDGLGQGDGTFRMDPYVTSAINEMLFTAGLPDGALDFLHYHSPTYHCDNERGVQVGDAADASEFSAPGSSGGYEVGTARTQPLPKVDALFIQGVGDNLFNLNEAWQNFECIRRAGGDVRLMTYEYGHQVITPGTDVVLEGLRTGSIPLGTSCGPIDSKAAAVAFMDEKLRGLGDANNVIVSGRDICLSLTSNEAVSIPEMPVGGEKFDVDGFGGSSLPITIGNPLPVTASLATIESGGDVIAGIPTATIEIGFPGDGICSAGGTERCDATVFIGIGVRRAGELVPTLMEEQVLPLRGVGTHEVNMVGIAERLNEGDEVMFMAFGSHTEYVATTSRDLTALVVFVSGEVSIPLVGDEVTELPLGNFSNCVPSAVPGLGGQCF